MLSSRLLLAFLGLVASANTVFAQGSLTPSGAPGTGGKLLDQIEPRIDVQRAVNPLPGDTDNTIILGTPGSYFLSGNLSVTKLNGIRITAPNVTLDLRGFVISRRSGTGGSGIVIESAATNCVVHDGQVEGFARGVECLNSPALPTGGTFARLTASGHSLNAFVSGHSWRLTDCTATGNSGNTAYSIGEGCVLEGCLADSNTGTNGFVTGRGCTLHRCSVRGQTGNSGISAGQGNAVLGCTVSTSTVGVGIFGDLGCELRDCVVRACTGTLAVSEGIRVGQNGLAYHCTSTGNTSTAAASRSTGVGIVGGDGAVIRGCYVQGNRGDGISLVQRGWAEGNQCLSNGTGGFGAGIYVQFTSCRVDGNTLVGNPTGLQVDGTANFIVRNTASSTGNNYVIAANNQYGPIVFISAATPAVTGNTGASTLGTAGEHAWANFAR